MINSENTIKQLNGHSGCIVDLIKCSEGFCVKKISPCKEYNKRLKRQSKKQKSFIHTNNVYSPEIYEEGFENDLYFFNMKFISGKTLAEYVEEIKISEINYYIKCLFKCLYIKDSKNDKKTYLVFTKKINSLENKLKKFPQLDNSFDILKKYDWNKVQKSFCHGDLTLENIIITKDKKLYLIDFLDSFYNSWMFDIAKLLQDMELKWSFRNTKISANTELRLSIAKETLKKELLAIPEGRDKLLTIYHLLLLNVVRIYPYIKDDNTLNFLNTSIIYLNEILNNKI